MITEKQQEVLDAVEREGGIRAAARALGMDQALVGRQYHAARRKLQAGVPWGPVSVPPWMTLKGQSVLVDGEGNLRGRWDKTTRAGLDDEDARQLPDPKRTVKLSTLRDADGRVIQQWQSEKPELVAKEQAWLDLAEKLSQKVARVELLPPPPPDERRSWSLVTGYPITDAHLGMLAWAPEVGEDYDLAIGRKLLVGAMSHLTSGAYRASTGLVVFLGDNMHYDSFEAITPTSKNQLDSDSRYAKVAWATVEACRTAIDLALRAHDQVFVVVKGGNHDPSSAVFLELCIKVAYEQEPRVEVLTSPAPSTYWRFGKVLLGFHHGHMMKGERLAGTMAADVPELWGATKYRHWWTGHVHHMKACDYQGCSVESFRVMPPADAYGHGLGYRPYRDMKAITFHEEFGEVARHTVNPAMLEGAR